MEPWRFNFRVHATLSGSGCLSGMKSVTLILLLLAGGLLCTAQKEPDTLALRMDSIFKTYNHSSGPGCAVSIIRDGKVIFEKGYGMASLEYDVPISPGTVFDIASVSKQFTGFAISTLIQEGKISPDDDIHQYLPDLPPFGKKIRIRNLLHHTSGIRDWPQTLNYAGWRYDEIFSYTDIMRMVGHQKELDFEPGSTFSYSNTAYNLLAAIVEKVTGKSLREWEEEHIFKPLGMNATQVLDDYHKIIKQRAVSYYPQGNDFGVVSGALTAYGSSSIFSSVDDLNKWVIHFISGIRSKDPVFTRMLGGDTLNNHEKVSYGYGVDVNNNRGVYTIVHDGGWAGYRTIIINFPEENLSLILLGNTSDFDPTGYAYLVAGLFLKDKLQPEPKRENLNNLPTVQVDTVLMKKYTGTFQLGTGWYVTFTLENGKFMVQANGEDKFSTEAKSDSVFWVPAYGSSMNFKRSGNGPVNELRYRTINAKRVIPLQHTISQLQQYTGTFYSEELETQYQLSLVKDKLMLHHMRLGDYVLNPDPVTDDLLSGPIGTLHFLRNDKHAITGFRLSGGRVRNILFDKR